jgi:N-acetylmuramoyl-L-alanine amidase
VRPIKGELKPEETEAGIALIFGAGLGQALTALGHDVIFTRAAMDTPAPLNSRIALAKKMKADLLISLHLNAAPDGSKGKARGHEVLYRVPGDGSRVSAGIARKVSDAITPIIPPHGAGVIERPNLAVLSYSPSILIELGFIDHDGDFALLSDLTKRAELATAIAKAVTS